MKKYIKPTSVAVKLDSESLLTDTSMASYSGEGNRVNGNSALGKRNNYVDDEWEDF